MAMFDKLTFSGWLLAFVLIVFPCTIIAQSSTPTAGEIWKEPVTGMEFVWVAGGCYEMGCGSWTNDCFSDEKPVHEVCVDGFWMGKTEVTQGQWEQVMKDNPAEFKKGDNYPLENAFYGEMEKFMNTLSTASKGAYKFRFPTEAEWEHACRGGGKPEKYAGGSDLDQVAWYRGNSNRSTHAVATKAPNGLGLFDMNGNVHEWCADFYRGWAYSKHERNNPLVRLVGGDLSGSMQKVYRGGSWNSKPKFSRCAARSYELASDFYTQLKAYSKNDLGFRLVRSK